MLETLSSEPRTVTVGPVAVKPVKAGPRYDLPYITWGGDVATFHANGGVRTYLRVARLCMI